MRMGIKQLGQAGIAILLLISIILIFSRTSQDSNGDSSVGNDGFPQIAKEVDTGLAQIKERMPSDPAGKHRKKVVNPSQRNKVRVKVFDFETRKPLRGMVITTYRLPSRRSYLSLKYVTNENGEALIEVLSEKMVFCVSDAKEEDYGLRKIVHWEKKKDDAVFYLRKNTGELIVEVRDTMDVPVPGVLLRAHYPFKKVTKKTNKFGECRFEKLEGGGWHTVVRILDGDWKGEKWGLPKKIQYSVQSDPNGRKRLLIKVPRATGTIKIFIDSGSIKQKDKILMYLDPPSSTGADRREKELHLDGKPILFQHLPPGENYFLRIEQWPGSHLWFAGLSGTTGRLNVKEGEITVRRFRAIQGTLTIKGKAIDERGMPVPALWVDAYRQAPGAGGDPPNAGLSGYRLNGALLHMESRGTVTNRRGEFELKWLPPGTYYFFVFPQLVRGQNFQAKVSKIPPFLKAPGEGVVFHIKHAWKIRGRILFHGKKMRRGSVFLRRLDPLNLAESSDYSYYSLLSLRNGVEVDLAREPARPRGKQEAKGSHPVTFIFKHIPPGRYRLSFQNRSGKKFLPKILVLGQVDLNKGVYELTWDLKLQ